MLMPSKYSNSLFIYTKKCVYQYSISVGISIIFWRRENVAEAEYLGGKLDPSLLFKNELFFDKIIFLLRLSSK